MNIRKLIVVIAVFASASGVAFAQSSVGNAKWLHAKCVEIQYPDTVNSVDLEFYDTFIIAVAQVAESSTPPAVAIPSGTTFGQVFATVGRYLENHPEDWNKDAGTVVIKALQIAYPSKK
ncbi:MAG: Rap1a/Tai family immunity protein [Spirochaetia bacterium]|jgi:hypothetical protein